MISLPQLAYTMICEEGRTFGRKMVSFYRQIEEKKTSGLMKQLNEIRTKELRQYPLCRWMKAAENSFLVC